ncbi:MAG: tRNA uridine-5-carboxymethylaminomethyl(34) synthesis GTPase MnmE [Alphaproteobacteria bacterium]|nr:MAG: tRNA uridine-5-carboxymethylaminomethyl(34) synthesis GTPase MnmE [Alphaproteobacteria bacterium]
MEKIAGAGQTIFALSSGGAPSGVAVIRLSGPQTGDLVRLYAGKLPAPRRASLRTLRLPETGEIVDQGLVLWFPAPDSFTGEDSGEFHCHGSRSVVTAILDSLAKQPSCRLAEPGEFARRAFDNGKLDLTSVEGLADLINAQTEAQRRQALDQTRGGLFAATETWREALIEMRALVEARIDFSDEGDVAETGTAEIDRRIERLRDEVGSVVATADRGERVRTGFKVAIAGRPNAGKSTLLNALARREVAIVTDEPGTTRDILEVPLDLGGFPVLVYDTAGLRVAAGKAEQEGVRRALARAGSSDLILWLSAPEDRAMPPEPLNDSVPIWFVGTKTDLGNPASPALSPCDEKYAARFSISAKTGDGLAGLESALQEAASKAMTGDAAFTITRLRHKVLLEAVVADLGAALGVSQDEIVAELLRRAGDSLGRLTGRIDVEDVLDRLFAEFCIGK